MSVTLGWIMVKVWYEPLTINTISNHWWFVSGCVPIELKNSADPFSRKWKKHSLTRKEPLLDIMQLFVDTRLLPVRIRLWEWLSSVSYALFSSSPHMWAKNTPQSLQAIISLRHSYAARFLRPAIPQKNLLFSSQYEQHQK